MSDKEIAKVGSKEVAIDAPDFLADTGFTGFEAIGAEAYSIPFLKILQTLSPAVDESGDDYVEGAKPGMFFNTVTQELYGREMNLIILYADHVICEYKEGRKGFVRAHSLAEGKKLIRNMNEYPYVAKNGNDLAETLTLFVLNADNVNGGPMVFTLSGKALKDGKSFMSRMSMLKLKNGAPAPMLSSVYHVTTKQESNDKGRWFQIKSSNIKRIGWVTAEQYATAKNAYDLAIEKGANYGKEAGDDEEGPTEAINNEGMDEDSPF